MTAIRIFQPILAAVLLSAVSLQTAFAQEGVDPAQKEEFMSAGCWACHGTVGQGGAGPALVPDLQPFPVIETFVRQGTPNGMIPYPRSVLSDEQLHEIYSYLQSLPPPPEHPEPLER